MSALHWMVVLGTCQALLALLMAFLVQIALYEEEYRMVGIYGSLFCLFSSSAAVLFTVQP